MGSSKFRPLFYFLVLIIWEVVLPAPDGLAKAKACDKVPTGFFSQDIFLNVVTRNLPDDTLNGQLVQMRVHHMGPVYENGKCPNVHNYAAVLVHGRSVPGSPSFDLRMPPTAEDPSGGRLSNQEALAWAGIDSFAPDLLGYGGSWRGPLDDPCNASLPACVALNADGTCPANAPFLIPPTPINPQSCSSVAVGCDRSRNPPIFPLNQQANKPVGLGVNPGLPLCAHSSPYNFANPDVFASNVLDVIDLAIAEAKPRDGKVILLGYSFGGPSVGRALYLLGEDAGNKVKRAVFMASVFNVWPLPTGPAIINLPTEEKDLSELERSTSFPLALSNPSGWSGIGAKEAFCTGRITPDVINAFWDQVLAIDDLGDTWGGTVPNEYDENGELVQINATGLMRSPTFTRNGWNIEVANGLNVPTLVLNGMEDTTALVANSQNIFDNLTSVSNKLLVQVECSSHQFIGESCDGARCDDQNPSTTPYGQSADEPAWQGPHHTIAAALIEWVKYGTFNSSECGHFVVNASGIANEVPTANCPVLP